MKEERAVIDERNDGGTAGQTTRKTAPRYAVRDLLKGHTEIVLELDGHDYRLRLTSAGKLILTK